jgi:hypothetical protein
MDPTALLITPAELEADLKALEVEAMGWLLLTTEEGEQGYLHMGDPLVLCRQLTVNHPEPVVIEVVGVPDATMAGVNVLWVG